MTKLLRSLLNWRKSRLDVATICFARLPFLHKFVRPDILFCFKNICSNIKWNVKNYQLSKSVSDPCLELGLSDFTCTGFPNAKQLWKTLKSCKSAWHFRLLSLFSFCTYNEWYQHRRSRNLLESQPWNLCNYKILSIAWSYDGRLRHASRKEGEICSRSFLCLQRSQTALENKVSIFVFNTSTNRTWWPAPHAGMNHKSPQHVDISPKILRRSSCINAE